MTNIVEQYLQEHQLKMERVTRSLPQINALCERTPEDWCITLRLDRQGNIDFVFTGNKARMGQAWGHLRSLGWKPDDRPTMGEKLNEFSTYWHHEESHSALWFYWTSAVCKRKVIGKRMEEVNVYEIICDDDPVEPTIE